MVSTHDTDPQKYDYPYPASRIASSPARPRDSAKLLVYDRASKTSKVGSFKDIAQNLPPRAVLVFNQTKVVPARFFAHRSSGGKVTLLYTAKQGRAFDALANKSLRIGEQLVVGRHVLKVTKKLTKGFRLKPSFPVSNLFSVLKTHGLTPIPPYIKNSPLSERVLRQEYQTVFAKRAGSSAAPTASLHFTNRLISGLKRQGFAIEFLTLHVGLGTFAPLTQEQLARGKLHKEWYEISAATAKRLELYKKQGRPVIAVGTTVVRALESASNKQGQLKKRERSTDIFIYPPYQFKFISGLITNFHVPQSSLMMLVASLIGREKLLALYAIAIKKKFRLFSFGDGMLIK